MTAAGATDQAGEETKPGRPHRRWRIVALPVAIVVLGVGFVGLRYVFRSKPAPKSVDVAIDEFRSGSSTTEDLSPSFQRPAAGVYQANGEGSEHVSFPPNSQDDGAVMPVTVTYLDAGCWRWHLDYNTAHWHEYDFCPQGANLLLVAQRNSLSWDFGTLEVTNLGEYVCDPPSPIVVAEAEAGTSFEHRCVGNNSAAPGESTSAGPGMFVGNETLEIGGRPTPAIHQSRRQRISGPQNGTIDEDWWFAADTGLPLRAERRYLLDTASPVGTISYEEDGSWQLASLQPQV